jgi:subtilisin family serine protease
MVEIAEPDYIRHTTELPNDPLYAQQWALPRINAPAAWASTFGSSSVTVAVIDTGYDLTHPDKPANLIPGPTFTSVASQDGCAPEGVNGPQDDFGHGTHVGGIIAAATNNNTGVAGLAPGVTLLVIKAGDCVGNLADSDVAAAIDYATSAGARVINMSFGGTDNPAVVSAAIQNAWSSGVVLVAAAGNDAASEHFYPAALPNVVAVAATDNSDTVAYFSNRGCYVALAAPGVGILSTVPMGTPIHGTSTPYASLSGTSMATPHVAAAAALLLSATSGLTNSAVTSILEQTAVPLGTSIPNQTTGYGRIDVAAALSAALGGNTQAQTPTPSGLTPRAYLPLVLTQSC